MAVELVKAKPQAPKNFLIIGEPFSGKTTLAAKAPNPLFVSTDGNAAKAGLAAVNVTSVQDVKEAIQLALKDADFDTIVLDTIEGIYDLITKDVIDEANQSGRRAANGEKIKTLADVAYGILTAQAKQKLQAFAEALSSVKKNVVILSYSKRQVDEISGSFMLSSELKDIRLITRFMDAQVLTSYDGDKYKAEVISKRETLAGKADLSKIDDFLKAIGWTLPKRSTNLGKAPKR